MLSELVVKVKRPFILRLLSLFILPKYKILEEHKDYECFFGDSITFKDHLKLKVGTAVVCNFKYSLKGE